MSVDQAGWALLFLVLVAAFVAVGIVVGMIVARRVDVLQAPKPVRPPDDAPAAPTVQEDHEP